MAGDDHRYGLAHPACATAHRGQWHIVESPYLVVLVLVAAVSFAVSLAVPARGPRGVFLMPTRAWQLAVGGLIALTASQWHRVPALLASIAGWVGLGVILLTCSLLGTTTPYPGLPRCCPCSAPRW